ncbi:hypothetical protein MSPP1_002610 [Malassezia sp. CBS 17886]|nr:hypothetical protein MSPP1_002610 [Malassezia sp. CBS 17886]
MRGRDPSAIHPSSGITTPEVSRPGSPGTPRPGSPHRGPPKEPLSRSPSVTPPPPAAQDADATGVDDVYSAFSRPAKVFIVACAAMSGFMSPFAINIFMPAIPVITQALAISNSQSLLAVTVYMIFQGLSPSIWGPLSDQYGRRPILIATFTVFLVANLGLSFANVYWALLLLRMLQACGASSAIAIGAGCISDVSQRKERGTYMGYFQAGTLIGPSIGPVIGGLMSQNWDWHAVFFFLAAFGGVFLMFLVLILPESLRCLVGNGALRPVGIWRTPIRLNLLDPQFAHTRASMRMPPRVRWSTLGFGQSWRMFAVPDVAMMVAAYALPFCTFTLVTTTLSQTLKGTYGYSNVVMGLCFLPVGAGSAVGSVLSGIVLDWDYRRAAQKYGLHTSLYRARLKNLPMYSVFFHGLAIANGWCLDHYVHIAAPLLLQFFASLFAIMYFNSLNTILVDLYPDRAASVTAAINIGRCLLAALFVGVVQYMIDAMGLGWMFTMVSLLTFILPIPLTEVVMRIGPHWHAARAELRVSEKPT